MDEDQKQNIQIEIFDHYSDCLKDKFDGIVDVSNRFPKGFVEIYETDNDGNNKKLIGKSNLVLYTGREFVAQSIFGVNNPAVTSSYNDHIFWFGVGDGGAGIDFITPTAPTNTDNDLGNSVLISTDSTNADPFDVVGTTWYYKKPIYSVEFQQDIYNNNTYLIAKATLILESGDSNGYNISEAGLFASPSSAGGSSGPFTIYARVTFPSIVKSVGRILTFIWYVFV